MAEDEHSVKTPTNTATTSDKTTEYEVLGLLENGDWQHLGTPVHSRSAAQAIRERIDTHKGQGFTQYVAVPTRSWKPVTVRVEQVSRVILEDA